MRSYHLGIYFVSILVRLLPEICVSVCLPSYVQIFLTLWTAAHQAPLRMECSRQEYWSGTGSFYVYEWLNKFVKKKWIILYFRLYATLFLNVDKHYANLIKIFKNASLSDCIVFQQMDGFQFLIYAFFPLETLFSSW